MEKQWIKRVGVLVVGTIILSASIALFIFSDFGVDPYTSLNIALSSKLGMNFALFQILLNFLILLVVLIFDRSFIHVGTLIVMVVVGPLIEFFGFIWGQLFYVDTSALVRLILLLTACITVSLGVALIMSSDLGMGPYDIIAPLIEKRKNWPFKWIRVASDGSCALIALVLGGPIGFATIIAALGLGPIISFFRTHIMKWLYQK